MCHGDERERRRSKVWDLDQPSDTIHREMSTYPTETPSAHVTGISAKACAMLVESVNSPIMLFMTPVFPLSSPLRHRLFSFVRPI
jgi:hypothetical protein